MIEGSEDILARVEGGVGLITLNRPKAINSLNQPMVDVLAALLTRWEHDDDVRAVVLCGAGDRGLCAGGDVVAIYHKSCSLAGTGQHAGKHRGGLGQRQMFNACGTRE